MTKLIIDLFDNFIKPGKRFDWLEYWLLNEVWSVDRYNKMEAAKYLRNGEETINECEEIAAAAASRLYDELAGDIPIDRDAGKEIRNQDGMTIVVFDGLSLREIPLILQLADKSNMEVVEVGATPSVLPTETIDYVEKRLRFGATAPSRLPAKKELRSLGIAAYYYDNPNQRYHLDENTSKLLLWSAFPDNTYSDSGARFEQHFQEIQALLDNAWMNTVQQIPKDIKKIIITSDHGYAYFGSGLSFSRAPSEVKKLTAFFGGDRYRKLEDGIKPPEHPDVLIYDNLEVALLRGRVQTHPPGKSSSRLYKHGGFSLMEFLTPWIELAYHK